jgi:hypothetical protein
MVRRTDSAGLPDLIGMQALVQRIWSPTSRWHIGDVAWTATSLDGAADAWRTAVWTDGGETVAWGWAEAADGAAHLDLVVQPARPELARVPTVHTVGLGVHGAGDEEIVAALTAHGYTVDSGAGSTTTTALADLEPPVQPDGSACARSGRRAARGAASGRVVDLDRR